MQKSNKSIQSAIMAAWTAILDKVLKQQASNMSEVSRQLGWRENRLAQLKGRGQVPNAIDAVKLCRWLNLSVEDVFGIDAGLTPEQIADRKTEQRLIAEIQREVAKDQRRLAGARSKRNSA